MSPVRHYRAFLLTFAVLGALPACAQDVATPFSSSENTAAFTMAALPEAPSAVMGGDLLPAETGASEGFVPMGVSPKYRRTVKPDQTALPLNAGDKMALSVMTQLTVASLAGNLFSAGISHVRDGRPHYGVDKGAFGERLGALSLKSMSQSFFSYGLYAAAFHDDPRYYVMGPSHKVTNRAIYSAMRVFVTRKDNGDKAINWPRLAGITSSAALANAYYPERDRGVKNTAYSIFGSIGTTALTNEVSEFCGDLIRLIRHKK